MSVNFDNPLIAVVDDSEDICYMISEICNSRGWKTKTANNVDEIEDLLEDRRISLFVVDYYFPLVDGVEIVRMIRKRFPNTPVIALTGADREDVMQRFIDVGVNDYALKPIRAIDFIARISAHLKYKNEKLEYSDVTKGISPQKVELILHVFRENGQWMDADSVADSCGVSLKSVYRYLKYLECGNLIEMKCANSNRLGRPRQLYRYRK